MKYFRWLYLTTALVWGSAWIPYSYGYYGLPWGRPVFEKGIIIFAWGMLIMGSILFLLSIQSKRSLFMALLPLTISAYSLWSTYRWLHAWHHN